ncbi:MAG: helix-turn-helix domain-containing protein [Imperialibacter sp.]|uniref:helix-turn-helix domain-containing protein n=1 Tax=Imperialibacter sp. TaxID=2038411 RepID=UPI0032EBD390
MNIGLLQILLFAGCIQAILLATYLFFHSAIRGSRLFGFLLLFLAIHLFLVTNDRQEFFMQFPHLLHVTWLVPSLYGPIILIFVRRITRYSLKPSLVEWLYFVPFVLLAIYHMPFYLQSANEKQAYIADFALSVKDDFGLINQLVNMLHVTFFSASLWFYNLYRKKILNYAAAEETRLLWLGNFLWINLAIVCVGVAVFYARKYNLSFLGAIYPYHFLGVIFLIYWSAYKLIRQPAIFQSETEEGGFAEVSEVLLEPEVARPVTEQHRQLASDIKKLMEEEKLYRTAGLTLLDLCAKVKSNKQYVSEAINLVFGKNFYDFVNEYRLKEFTDKLESQEDQNLTLLGIASNAGFNSKATFNAVFKKHYGVTPSEYQRGNHKAQIAKLK